MFSVTISNRAGRRPAKQKLAKQTIAGRRACTELHCVPVTTVSFQKHAACSKINRFPKLFHWVITNDLTFVSNV